MSGPTPNLASNKLIIVKFLPWRDSEADVASFSPSSEQMKGMWVMWVYIWCGGASYTPLVERWWYEHKPENNLVERQVIIDSVRVKLVELKDFVRGFLSIRILGRYGLSEKNIGKCLCTQKTVFKYESQEQSEKTQNQSLSARWRNC